MDIDLKNLIENEPFIHPAATVMGMVRLAKGSSIWPGVILRADMNEIIIGQGVNIQDGTVVHTDSRRRVTIGDFSLIGHRAMLHGCSVGRGCLIGINATILDEAEIGDGAMIMAGCTIRGGKKIPPMAMVLPDGADIKIIPKKARILATLTGSIEYMLLRDRYLKNEFQPFTPEEEKNIENSARELLSKIFPEL